MSTILLYGVFPNLTLHSNILTAYIPLRVLMPVELIPRSASYRYPKLPPQASSAINETVH